MAMMIAMPDFYIRLNLWLKLQADNLGDGLELNPLYWIA